MYKDSSNFQDAHRGKAYPIEGIALIPAHLVSGSHSEAGYGFPARFRIDVSDEVGFRTFQSVADHTETDLPNPGDYPYYVATPGVRGRYVRVTATKLWRGKNEWLFALGELVVLSGTRNVAAGKAVRATGDRTQEIPPA